MFSYKQLYALLSNPQVDIANRWATDLLAGDFRNMFIKVA